MSTPVRWTENTTPRSPEEKRAAELFREGDWGLGAAPPSADFLARTERPRWRRKSWRGWLILAVLGPPLAFAAWRSQVPVPLEPRHEQPVEVPQPVSAPAPAPTPAAPAPAPRPHRRVSRAPSPVVDIVEPRRSSLTDERELLAQAVGALRRDNDPAKALRELDIYSDRYPRGMLESEALLVRTEALIKSGQTEKLRQLLDTLSPERLMQSPRASELRVLRAELRAASGGCVQALADVEKPLDENADDELVERSLITRASCRWKLGNRDRAREDLKQYLAQFPHGLHERQARALLEYAGP